RRELPAAVPVTLLFNKCDLARGIPLDDTASGPPRIAVSARTGAGLDVLRSHLKSCVGYRSVDAGTVSARQRHLDALARARAHIHTARELTERRQAELIAQELHDAQQCLCEITGEFTAEDLLGRIFASFCVGK